MCHLIVIFTFLKLFSIIMKLHDSLLGGFIVQIMERTFKAKIRSKK